MKKAIYFMSAFAMLICYSCGSGEKPSQRSDVWGNTDTITVKEISLSSEKVFVPFQRTASGLAQVQVSLNGVPFNMWWDTGASITCISALELQKLAKEGKIELDDYMGNVVSGLADGSSSEEAVFNIKEIFIPGRDNKYLRLTDVAAVVSANAEAPLLIGQNVISNLPKHTFNDATEEIEFDK